MNKRIRDLNIEDLLFFDIETVRVQDDLEVDSNLYKVFRYKNRNKEDQTLLPEAEVLKLWKDKAALSPIYGKIVCISMAFVKSGKVIFKSFTGNEGDILRSFFDIWNKSSKWIPCGHNIVKFDIPFCRIRGSLYGISCPDKFNDSEAKPWIIAENVVDTMDVMSGCFIVNFSLEELCVFLGVKSPKGSIDGSKVSDVFYKEGVGNIATYCEGDVIAVVECLNKISSQNLALTYEPKVDVSGPIYEKITKAKKLTAKLTKDLMEFKDKYIGREQDFEKLRPVLTAASTVEDIRNFIKTY